MKLNRITVNQGCLYSDNKGNVAIATETSCNGTTTFFRGVIISTITDSYYVTGKHYDNLVFHEFNLKTEPYTVSSNSK